MAKIVFDIRVIQTISMFEKMTGARVKDCILGDTIMFVVADGEIGKAIGKGGVNVKKLEQRLKKRIKLVEFNVDVLKFVRNLVAPLRLESAELDDAKLLLTAKDLKTRGLLIGRSASNLRGYEAIIQRYFPIEEVRVS